jgi:tRNA-Thr(GGU) m(6)t(6)A37 methyltransferase TsaA
MKKIVMNPIGKINSPYKQSSDIPIQGRFEINDVEASIELDMRYTTGLKDLDGFSHAYVLYFFHKTDQVHLEGKPYLEDDTHGIFAIRSPHRPNHIGQSIIKIERIEKNRIFFKEVDMLDGTPVLDIKPYVKYFDCRDTAVCGWIDKHFKNGKIPDNVINKK